MGLRCLRGFLNFFLPFFGAGLALALALEVEMDDELEDDCGLFASLLFGSILCCGKIFVLWLMVVLFFVHSLSLRIELR